jgi:hypothetical protein
VAGRARRIGQAFCGRIARLPTHFLIKKYVRALLRRHGLAANVRPAQGENERFHASSYAKNASAALAGPPLPKASTPNGQMGWASKCNANENGTESLALLY